MTHFDFLPYNGSVHPFSFFFLKVKMRGVSWVHLERKCSYRSLTVSKVSPECLLSILLTISCNSYMYREKVSRFSRCLSSNGFCFKLLVRLMRQYLHGNTLRRLYM